MLFLHFRVVFCARTQNYIVHISDGSGEQQVCFIGPHMIEINLKMMSKLVAYRK